MSFQEALQKIGFSPIEANVYTTLCKHGALTGYEVAKLSGISRSNVYAALYSLQEKGKCVISEGETTKYVALTKEELLLSTKRDFAATLSIIEQYYPASVEVHEPYVTIRGYENVLDQIKNSILLCQSHLYLLCPTSYIESFIDELESTSKRANVTIICDKAITFQGNVTTYYRRKRPTGFHLIIDTKSVLTGDIDYSNAQCLFSKSIALVRLMRESFITELDMIKLNQH